MDLQQLVVPLVLDNTKFNKSIDASEQSVNSFSKNVSSKLDGVGSKLKGVGKTMAMGFTVPILAVGGAAVMAASNLEQAYGSVKVVYGEWEGLIISQAETAWDTVGLSKRAYSEIATSYGAMLTNMGFSQEEAAEMAIGLIQRNADMAATFGGTTQQVAEASLSAFKGQFDPLEKYGVTMTAAIVKQRAVEMGLIGVGDELDANSKSLAVQDLLYQMTAKTEGQFAAESETLAVQMQKTQARMENLSGEIGDILMPYVLELVIAFTDFLTKLEEMDPEMLKTIVTILGIVAAVGPLLMILGSLIPILGTVFTVIGAVIGFIISPVGAVILLIVGIIAALHHYRDEISAFFVKVHDKIIEVWGKVKAYIVEKVVAIIQKGMEMKAKIVGAFNAIKRALAALKRFFQPIIDKIKEIAAAMPDWLIPGSPTDFEIGLKGIREEFVKISATGDFPGTREGEGMGGVGGGAVRIDYERLAHALAHELQLVIAQ